MSHKVSFVIPAKREFVGLVRLAIGGLSQVKPFDIDTVEDLKLVMSEICTSMIFKSAGEPSDISFSIEIDGSELTLDIDSAEAVNELVSSTSSEWAKTNQGEYGPSIITALMDKVELVSNGNGHSVLRLKKFF